MGGLIMQLTTNLLIGSLAAVEISAVYILKSLVKKRSRIIVE